MEKKRVKDIKKRGIFKIGKPKCLGHKSQTACEDDRQLEERLRALRAYQLICEVEAGYMTLQNELIQVGLLMKEGENS